jgi:DNA-binding transcriptional ArsR family regulator
MSLLACHAAMSEPQPLDATLVKALGHPLRVRILEAITDRGEASPVTLAREFDRPLATVSHHARVLRDLGCIELARTEPRRGAVEHFYRAVRRPFIEDDEWEQLPTVMRRGMARQLFRQIFAEASQAGGTGGFDEPNAHISRVPLQLDQRGWRELSDLLGETLRRAEEVERRSHTRSASRRGRGGPVTLSELAIFHFRVATPATPAALPHEVAPRPVRRPRLP